jgi:CRP-like cAMP-binding protein/ferredoxin-NADP reductase/cytochrome P450
MERSPTTLLAALRRNGLFRGLPEGKLGELARDAAEVDLHAGQLLFREGDAADAMYVVLDGAVQVSTHDSSGREVVLARLEAGDHLGEQALLPGASGRRGATVRAVEVTILSRITRAAFDAALGVDRALAGRLGALGEQQVRANLERVSTLARALELTSITPGRRTLDDGEVLFRQGDEADALYLIRAGRVAVFRDEGGERRSLGRVERGGCVGELALIRKEPRAATVVAEGPVELEVIPRDQFAALYQRSGELREHVATLSWLYQLPSRGLATQYQGVFAGEPCITTLFQLDGGRSVAAYRLVARQVYAAERVGTRLAEVEKLTWSHPSDGRSRELHLAPDGEIVGLTAHGLWEDAGALHLFLLDGGKVGPEERARFLARGELLAPALPVEEEATVTCRCLGLTLGDLRGAIARGAGSLDRLQAETHCGTVCGGCVPRVVELLGEDQWILADVTAERDEAPGIRSFELAPRRDDFPSALPGQHIIVEGVVRGVRVQRPYTVSGQRRGAVRITVKREDNGVFSNWLFDQRPKGEPLRITVPRGEVVVDLDAGAVCMAAGIGVTPALAAAARRISDGKGTLTVHYSGHSRSDMAGLDELARAEVAGALRLLVRETGREGRLDAAGANELHAAHPNARFFLCGPDGYLDEVSRLLRKAGVASDRIVIESFTPIGAPPPQISDEERHAVERMLLVAPEPKPEPRWRSTLRRVGATITDGLNHRLADWRVGGVQLNPLRVASRALIGKRVGLDPNVPYEQLGVVTVLSHGIAEYPAICFRRYDALADENRRRALDARARGTRLPPDTPDGDTFAFTTPAPPPVEFPDSVRVDTGWKKLAEGALLLNYVLRGRTAIDHVYRNVERHDRGPVPYHYFQQVVGRRDIQSRPGCKAAGLFAGQMKDNSTWSEDRATTTEMFGLPSIDGFSPAMTSAVAETCTSIEEAIARDPERVIDANVMMSKVAYTIIVRAAFGGVDLAELHQIGAKLSESLRTLLQYVFSFSMGRQSVPQEYITQCGQARGAIAEIVDLLRRLDADGKLPERARNIPPVKMALAPGKPDYDRVYTLFLPLIIAGHETTGHTLSWAVYEIGRDRDLEAQVVAEIGGFRARHGGRAIGTADYDERPIMFALLGETLRAHSPVSATLRTALEPGMVPPNPETGIGGFRYPKGAMFVAAVNAVHRDPRRWRDPERFTLDHFLDAADPNAPLAERGRAVRQALRTREENYDLIPFAAGPGRCPGNNFNAHEFVLVLDALLSRFRFELADPNRVVRNSETMITGPEPGAIGVRIRRR